uniref:(northern house mosquito) hypothetical protein n=1 Tax=Culex pipiens TaxID=7175 RepID=A0A8D8AUU2_CULPI
MVLVRHLLPTLLDLHVGMLDKDVLRVPAVRDRLIPVESATSSLLRMLLSTLDRTTYRCRRTIGGISGGQRECHRGLFKAQQLGSNVLSDRGSLEVFLTL